MSLRAQLQAYIGELEKRLRWSALLRGVAILAGTALAATLLFVVVANAFAFSQGSVTASRFGLIVALAIAAAAGLALPLRRLTRRRAVGKAEAAFPQFQQRLITFTERESHDPFIELLAGETLNVAQSAEPKQMVTGRRLWSSLAVGVGSLAVLVWMIAAGPGFIGYGASLLWTGPHSDKPSLYDLRVAPGDAVVRRHADQLVSAIPTGMNSPAVKLYARFQSSAKWEEISMLPQTVGSFAKSYQFVFAGLPENVEYYVTAGAMTSKHYNIRVTDLPSVKQIRVTYHYPAWTGLPSETEERGGDLRAVLGTEAELEVSTDRPLQDGQIQLDSGQKIQLTGGQNNVYRAAVKMDQDGVYHIAGIDQGQPVRVSEDFFIEARKANPPQIALVQPRADYHALPIEEVSIALKATDEYGLKDVSLHYSVNGGPEATVDLLKQKGQKDADGSTTLSLENFKLVPGDLVSFYATAKDANAESHTDILFIQADPYERNFTQSQQAGGRGGGGGGGGGGNQPAQITQREKEIISQTFKQENDKNATQQQAVEISKLLSQSQATLHDQAITLSGRLQARELTDEVQAISEFQKDMVAASGAMEPAAKQLEQQKWKDAIPNEQKALQFLQRAEATYRDIQVAFGARGGGGGGGGGGAARDLAALFDLELDTEKNQYETQQSASASEEQKQQEIDDALKKLDELAKREEALAQQQRNGQQQTAEEKYQQEMLQREAEQLKQQMEQQLGQSGQQGQQSQSAQNSQGKQGQQKGQASAGASGRGGNGQPSGGQSASQGNASAANAQSPEGRQQAAQQALDRLRQGIDDMKRAGSQNGSSADARRAADRLREATDRLGQTQAQDANGKINSMAQTAQQLADRQKEQADRMRTWSKQLSAATPGQQQKGPTGQDIQKLIDDRQGVTDDLAHLTQQMRDEARALADTQQAASNKLRGALSAMDENALDSRLQHSSDFMLSDGRFSDQSEAAMTSDLQKLSQQIGDAARALGNAQSSTKEAELNRAMDDLSRVRDQIDRLGRNPGQQPGQGRGGQGQQPGQQPGQSQAQGQGQGQGQGRGQQQAKGGQGQGGQGQGGQGGQGGQLQQEQLGQGGQGGRAGQGQNGQPGQQGDRIADQAKGGGGRGGIAYGNIDTGNNSTSGPKAVARQGAAPADTQRDIDQGLDLLNQVRAAVQDSPEAKQQLQALIDEMRNLDPKRFPGNQELMEQIHQQLLSNVDALELELRHQLDTNRGMIRNTDPAKVPPGYQDSVAEYYRKLSNGSH